MQIKTADIYSFGRWTNQHFDFVDGLQVIEGLNGSGKTTLHQFLVSMLFGFPQAKKANINTYELESAGQYGGQIIVDIKGTDYLITRVGRLNSNLTLQDMKTHQLLEPADQHLKRLLGPVDRNLFEAIYSFSQEDLLQVFSLKMADFVEQLRQLATPGSNQWLNYAAQLEKQAVAQMGMTKTAKRPINQALETLKNKRMVIRDKEEKQPDLVVLLERQRRLEEDLATLNETESAIRFDDQQKGRDEQRQLLKQRLVQIEQKLTQFPAPLDAKIVQELQQLEVELRLDNSGGIDTLNKLNNRLFKAQADIERVNQLQAWNLNYDEGQGLRGTDKKNTSVKKLSGVFYVIIGLIGLGLFISHHYIVAILVVILGIIAIRWYQGHQLSQDNHGRDDLGERRQYAQNQQELNQLLADLAWLDVGTSEAALRQKVTQLRAKIELQQEDAKRFADKKVLQQRLLGQLQIADMATFHERLQVMQTQQRLQQEINVLRKQLEQLGEVSHHATSALTYDDVQKRQAALTEELARLNVTLKNYQDDRSLQELYQDLATTEAAINDQLTHYFVDRLTARWITQTLEVAIQDRLPRLLMTASQLFNRLTQKQYQQIKLLGKDISVQQIDHSWIKVAHLSKGTAEQLYVAMRLAFAKVVAQELQLPFLIDDAFVDFDEPRQQTMLAILRDIAKEEGIQIFYFTARPVIDETKIYL